MEKEYKALEELNSWTYSKPNWGKPVLRCHWVFKLKADGTLKSRLTVDGRTHYTPDTFASVGTKEGLRSLISYAVTARHVLRHIDISNAFLYGSLTSEEEVQMRQPDGIPKRFQDGIELICILKKSLYGLKNAPRIWQKLLNSVLQAIGFSHSAVDSGIWYNTVLKIRLWIYVDDMVMSSPDNSSADVFVSGLARYFKLKDMGRPTRVLGIQFDYIDGGVLLHQSEYANMISSSASGKSRIPMSERLERDDSADLDLEEHDTYRKIVGSLLYLVVGSRPDLAYCVSSLGKFVSKPQISSIKASMRVLEYVRGTCDVGLFFSVQESWTLRTFSDSDHCGDKNRLSRYANVTQLGGHTISWSSKSLTERTLSSTESELYSATFAGIEALHLSKLQTELLLGRTLKSDDSVLAPELYVDNLSTVKVLVSEGYTSLVRHIEIRNLWLIQKCSEKRINARWIKGSLNPSDIGTKPLDRVRLYLLMHLLNMKRITRLEGNTEVFKLDNLSSSDLVICGVDEMREFLE